MINIKFIAFILLASLICGCVRNRIEEVSVIIGKIIVIDPGHGGVDNGASYNNVLEDEINLEIALLLQQKLLEEGVMVLMTRNADYDLSDMYSNNRKNKDLKNRVEIINHNKVDLFISLHMNVYSDSRVEGGQVFYQKNNEDSKKIASILQGNLNNIQDKKRKEKIGEYYILDKTDRIGVLVEMGFLTSTKDVEKLSDENYKNLLSNTIINSIKIYFEQ